MRRRAFALEEFLLHGHRKGRDCFERCEMCFERYTLPPGAHMSWGPRRLPYAWAMVSLAWLVDALVLLLTLECVGVAVLYGTRAALALAVFEWADRDGSGELSVAEAVGLANATGDVAGAEALPRVIAVIPPVGKPHISRWGLFVTYCDWIPTTLAQDALALGVLAPARGERAASLGLCAEQLVVTSMPACCARLIAAGVAAMLALNALCARAYVRRVRHACARVLCSGLCNLHAARLGLVVPSRNFWAAVFAESTPVPRPNAALFAIMASAHAQWAIAGGAWLVSGVLLQPRLLLARAAPVGMAQLLNPLLARVHGGCALDSKTATARTATAQSSPFSLGPVSTCAVAGLVDLLLIPVARSISSGRRRAARGSAHHYDADALAPPACPILRRGVMRGDRLARAGVTAEYDHGAN